MSAHSSELDPDDLFDPKWNPVLGGLLRYLEGLRERDASPPRPASEVLSDPHDLLYATVRDLVLNPATGRCVLGKGWLTLDRDKAIYEAARKRCRGGKCPHCIDYWLLNRIRRALTMFEFPDVLYSTTFPSLAEFGRFKRKKAGRAFVQLFPNDNTRFWVRHVDGSLRVSTAVPPPGVDYVQHDHPEMALLKALLACKAYPGKGYQRHSDLPEDVKAPPAPGRRAQPLATGVTLASVREELAERLDRDVPWVKKTGRRAHSFSVRYSTPLAPDEFDAADQHLDYHKERRDAQFWAMVEYRRSQKRLRELFAEFEEEEGRRPNADERFRLMLESWPELASPP